MQKTKNVFLGFKGILNLILVLVLSLLFANPIEATQIQLLTTSQLTGHATVRLDDISILYDEAASVYKMWALASTGAGGAWSVYYGESASLENWSLGGIQELYWGTSGVIDFNRQFNISVVKESNTSYKMWYFIPQTGGGGKGQIFYRSSNDGITWGAGQVVYEEPAQNFDIWPTAVPLQSGNYRIYYSHTNTATPAAPTYLMRMNVLPDGITESEITQINPLNSRIALAAVIRGNQSGDNYHSVWASSASGGGNLFRYDSLDEGNTWVETDMGVYDTSSFSIVGALYDPHSGGSEGFLNLSADRSKIVFEGTLAPEPSSFLLIGAGLSSLLVWRRKKRISL